MTDAELTALREEVERLKEMPRELQAELDKADLENASLRAIVARCEDVEEMAKAIRNKLLDEGFKRVEFMDADIYIWRLMLSATICWGWRGEWVSVIRAGCGHVRGRKYMP